MMSDRHVIATAEAAAAVGPYSQGISANGMVFISGQLPIDLKGVMPEGIEAQTRQSLVNVLAVLKAAGSSQELVLKTTVFLKNMDDFAAMNTGHRNRF
jgi:2-iminobutanoate/2-iminopropanoate deaminase